MDVEGLDGSEIGRRLAERHAADDRPDGVDEVASLLNYAEAPHTGDWTLRSSLVRLAQPDPARVGALLQVMRRLDAPLHHVTRALQANPANSDLGLLDDPGSALAGPAVDTVTETVPDIRLADVARVIAAGLDEASVVDGYRSVVDLGQEEQLALPLLVVAVAFDRLARELADWADAGSDDPPLAAVERVTAQALARLDELGVPEETPPPRGGRNRG